MISTFKLIQQRNRINSNQKVDRKKSYIINTEQTSKYKVKQSIILFKQISKQTRQTQLTPQQMLKSFIQLNLHSKHDKSQYQIKKNKLVLLSTNVNHQYSECTVSGYRIMVSKMPSCYDNNINNNNNNNRQSISSTLSSSSSSMGNMNSVFRYQQQEEVNFDYIGYDYKSMNQKILYELLMVNSNSNRQSQKLTGGVGELTTMTKTITTQSQSMSSPTSGKIDTTTTTSPIRLTITFNYDIQYQKLQQLIIDMMQIKKFQQSKFQIAHFQLRNNHVSDYNKAKPHTNSIGKYSNNHGGGEINYYGQSARDNNNNDQSEQMDQFTKQIDTCIKLDKTYNIKDNIKFKKFTKQDYKSKDVLNKNTRTNYQKKTNEFFLLNIDEDYQIYLIIFHRQRDYVLTKIEEKEIQKAFVLYKGSKERGTVKLQFTTSLAQILQSFLNQSNLVIFLTQYPTPNHTYTLAQQLHMPRILDPNQPSSIDAIIQQYNKQKQSKLQIQMHKMKVKLREIKHKRKTTQQNINYLMRKYKKGFQNIFDSLSYLKKNNINDIKAYKDNLEIEIKQKEEDIRQTLELLKEINLDMIQSAERSEYFRGRMQQLKESLEQDLEDVEVDYQGKNMRSGEFKGKQQQKDNKGQQKKIDNSQLNTNSNNKTDTLTANQRTTAPKSRALITTSNKLQQKNASTSIHTQIVSSTILKKILQVQQSAHNPYELKMQRQMEKYTNELRENTRQRLIKSKQVEEFKSVMEELRKRLTRSEFTKLEQKYLALISMC